MRFSRRTALALLGAGAASGCVLYSDPPPVVIGGAPVAADQPILVALRNSNDHQRLVAALEQTELADELSGFGPFTLFAPTDAAFESLRPKTDKARIESDPGFLKLVLLGHIVPARLTTEDLLDAYPQLNGKTKVFSMNRQVVRAAGDATAPRLTDLRKRVVKVVTPDAIAENGIIHVVDNLLLPKADALSEP